MKNAHRAPRGLWWWWWWWWRRRRWRVPSRPCGTTSARTDPRRAGPPPPAHVARRPAGPGGSGPPDQICHILEITPLREKKMRKKQDRGWTAAARRARLRRSGTPSSGRRTRTLLAPGRRAAQPVQPALLPCPAGYCGEGPPPAGVSLFVIVLAGSVVSFCRLHQHRHLLLLNDLSYQPARHS